VFRLSRQKFRFFFFFLGFVQRGQATPTWVSEGDGVPVGETNGEEPDESRGATASTGGDQSDGRPLVRPAQDEPHRAAGPFVARLIFFFPLIFLWGARALAPLAIIGILTRIPRTISYSIFIYFFNSIAIDSRIFFFYQPTNRIEINGFVDFFDRLRRNKKVES
jgi:hypothetical protein